MEDKWKFYTAVIDGQELRIDGLNIWEYQWKDLKTSIHVKDPLYGEDHLMAIYEISSDTRRVIFAAGEFSNLVWGIYLPV